MLGGSAWCPGLPKLPFLHHRPCILGALALRLRQASGTRPTQLARCRRGGGRSRRCRRTEPGRVTKSLPLDTLELEIGYGLIPLVDESQGGDLLKRVVDDPPPDGAELGLVLQPIRIRDNVQLASHEYAVRIKGVRGRARRAAAGCLLAMNPGDADPPSRASPPSSRPSGCPRCGSPQRAREHAEAAGYTVVDPASIVITHLTETSASTRPS